jgi:microcystin-dependent protein
MSREAFNRLWATTPSTPGNDASFKEPRSTIWGTGWEGGADKDAPKAGEQNWWQNRADFALQDLERSGVMSWNANASYNAGAPTKASDGNYYESINNANAGNDPAGTTGFWRLIGASLYNVIPVGSGVMVFHNGVPDIGWLKCNGAVLVRASYQRLFDAIGTTHNTGSESSTQFRLPDMRGEFPRGWDDSRGIDSGRAFGSAQAGDIQAHTHFAPTAVSTAAGTLEVPGTPYSAYDYINAAPTSSSGGTETRPRNKAVNFWIKY